MMSGLIAAVSAAGDYFSTAKILAVAVLAMPWLYLAPWIQRDAKRVMAPSTPLAATALAAGAGAMLLWLAMGSFLGGLLLYVLVVGVLAGAYVLYRNQRVSSEYRILTPEHIRSLLNKSSASRMKLETLLKVYNADSKIVSPPDEQATVEQRQAYNLAQQLLHDILYYRASEADISPVESVGRVRFVVDGTLLVRPDLEDGQCELVIQYLKGLAGMDISEVRRPQKGMISVDLASQPIDMVLTTAGTTTGQRMQFRVVQESIQTRLEELGMEEDVLAHVRAINADGTGLLIVSARSKNGLSSTLYSLLRTHDAFTKHLTALETKVASELNNVSQVVYDHADALPKVLATALRQEPNVVMVDRCDSNEAGRMIAEIAAKRLILLGVSAGDSLTALAKWVKTVGDPALATANLRGILSQVLIRKLCPDCKEAYAPDPAMLAKANLPQEEIESFYRPPTGPLLDDKGKPLIDKEGQPIPCPTCRGTGYFGRTGVFELLEVTGEIRQLIISGSSLAQIKAACRRNNWRSLQEMALHKVISGMTSIQEVIRVTQPKK